MKRNKENILITRALSEESPLRLLSNDGYHLIGHSFLEIIPQIITEIPKAEVYFYYSKNGAKHFIQAAQSLGIDLAKSKHAAMGGGTASTLSKYGITTDFIGSGKPSEVAQQLITKYADLSVCFVRANQSTQSIQKLWKRKYTEVITYSIKTKTVDIKEAIHTLIATSPMNFLSAMKCCDLGILNLIICIGPTTFQVAKKYTDLNVVMAEQSSEESLLEAFYKEKID